MIQQILDSILFWKEEDKPDFSFFEDLEIMVKPRYSATAFNIIQ